MYSDWLRHITGKLIISEGFAISFEYWMVMWFGITRLIDFRLGKGSIILNQHSAELYSIISSLILQLLLWRQMITIVKLPNILNDWHSVVRPLLNCVKLLSSTCGNLWSLDNNVSYKLKLKIVKRDSYFKPFLGSDCLLGHNVSHPAYCIMFVGLDQALSARWSNV